MLCSTIIIEEVSIPKQIELSFKSRNCLFIVKLETLVEGKVKRDAIFKSQFMSNRVEMRTVRHVAGEKKM